MKKLLLTGLAFLVTCGASLAADQIPEKLLLATGQFIGSGARAQGLGGTYTGIADDYSAIWWNPAGLAQIKRIEFQGSILRSGFSNDTKFAGNSRDGSTSTTRLNNLGVVFPVPVYQGALSFAFGYTQVVDFDRRTKAQLVDEAQVSYGFDELEQGRLGFWTFAGAVDVSPNLALGAGINYWRGSDEYTYNEFEPDLEGPVVRSETIDTKLSAWNFSFGGMFRAGRFARIGAMAQTAMSMSLDEDWTAGDKAGYFDYRMTYPAVFRLGGSVAPGRWMLAADVEYRDWESLKFRTDTPFLLKDEDGNTVYDGNGYALGVEKGVANQEIKDNYNSTTRISIGGEYLFPVYGIRARAGYSFEPSNFAKHGSAANRNALNFGVGVLIDRSVMLDVTYRTAAYEENFTPGLSEDIQSSSALITISYRM